MQIEPQTRRMLELATRFAGIVSLIYLLSEIARKHHLFSI